MPFDANAAGYMTYEDSKHRIPEAQLTSNRKLAARFASMNKKAEGAKDLAPGQIMELASKGRAMMLNRHKDWVPLDAVTQPIVLEEEQSSVYEDTLTVCAPKFMYTVIVPDGMTLDEVLQNSGPIVGTKTYTKEPGEFPEIPEGHYTMDISKDFAPAYLRTGIITTNPTIAAKDANRSYVRAQVVPTDQKDLAGVRADFLINERDMPDTRSLAQEIEAEHRLVCHAQILKINKNKPFPTDEDLLEARTLVKNIDKRAAFLDELHGHN